MGWLWSSGAASKPANTNNTKPEPTTPSPPTPSAAADAPTSDPEISKFFSQVAAELSTPTPAPPPPSQTTPSQTSTSPSTSEPVPHLDPLSESLLPTTMSCRSAFDQAFHCNSLGGQWTSVYRSGSMRTCSALWDEFWFCMRTRTYFGTVKEDAIRDYYREKEIEKYGPGKPNSTDIWEPRDERLPQGSMFQNRYEPPNISDEEWRRYEISRRRAIQRMLREEDEKAAKEAGAKSSSS